MASEGVEHRENVDMGTPKELIEQYRDAFTRGDLERLLGFFRFPLQVVSVADGASVSVVQADEWARVIARLLQTYEQLGVTSAVPLALDVSQPMDAVALVQVHWDLRGQGQRQIYDFTAVYTLVRAEGQLRIVAIAHDELPKLSAAMKAR
jgi:hypothetical protein